MCSMVSRASFSFCISASLASLFLRTGGIGGASVSLVESGIPEKLGRNGELSAGRKKEELPILSLMFPSWPELLLVALYLSLLLAGPLPRAAMSTFLCSGLTTYVDVFDVRDLSDFFRDFVRLFGFFGFAAVAVDAVDDVTDALGSSELMLGNEEL